MEPSAPLEVAEESPALEAVPPAEATLTLEEATARLSPKVLQALEDKFNGSLIQVRATDEKDQLF